MNYVILGIIIVLVILTWRVRQMSALLNDTVFVTGMCEDALRELASKDLDRAKEERYVITELSNISEGLASIKRKQVQQSCDHKSLMNFHDVVDGIDGITFKGTCSKCRKYLGDFTKKQRLEIEGTWYSDLGREALNEAEGLSK